MEYFPEGSCNYCFYEAWKDFRRLKVFLVDKGLMVNLLASDGLAQRRAPITAVSG